MPQVIDTDVLVVGAGGAALRAAIEAHQAGARVAMAVKGQPGAIGFRGAGATAAGTAADRRGFWPVDESGGVLEDAFDDILQLGLGMADPQLVRILVEEAPSTHRALERLGVRFRLDASRGGKGVAPGAAEGPRGFAVFALVPTLAAAVRRTDCLVRESTTITGLLLRDGACVGAVGVDEGTGEVLAFRAGAVILGTGGAAQLFKHNIHPPCVTGDGYAMGYRAGAELINLEYLQIYLGIPFPSINNLTNWVWGQDVRVCNALGEEFLDRYLPPGASLAEARAQAVLHSPFSTRDSLSRYLAVALMKEVMAGHGTAHDGIYMDLTAPGVRAPTKRDTWLRYRGIQWDREPIQVVMYQQCSHGGLRIDAHGRTTVPGLYAVGECSAGAYGADRHGGNMICGGQVFGARAGQHAARSATGSRRSPLPGEALAAEEKRITALQGARGRLKPGEVRKELKQAAWNHLLAVRTEAGLARFLETVDGLRREQVRDLRVDGPKELVESLELENLLVVGEMLGEAARRRTESRGGHYREDYPLQDDANWLKSIVVKQVDGRLELATLALQPDWRSRPGDVHGERWG